MIRPLFDSQPSPSMKRVAALLACSVAAAFSQGPPPPRVPDGVKAFRDLVYVEGGHERHKLDLYLPAASDGPVPLLIWIHGGGWMNGSKEGCPPLQGGYVARGFAVASLNYRLSGHAVFPAQIEDCKTAIRWLRAHAREYQLDPDRFGVWGSSAGGHLAALLGTSGDVKEFDTGPHPDPSSRVQAVCDYYGPTDLAVMVATPGYESHASDSSPEARLFGGKVLENREKAARANPITHVSRYDPPFLIVHGDRDPTVPINQSQLLFEPLRSAGVSAHFHTIRGAGHGGPGFSGKDIEDLVAAFFEERLMRPSDRIDAKTTESAAAPGDLPPRGGARPGIPWEVISGRDDRNRDGKVSREEFSGPPPLWSRLDRNGDGFLTREEHEGARGAPPRPATPPRPVTQGFRLDGERWTYADGDLVMEGILLKPEGPGPFPAVLISHGLGGSARSFGLTKAREMVSWGLVCIAPDYTHAAGAAGDRSRFGASPENLRRARACLGLLRAMPEVDGERLAAYGHSMGGFVTIALAAAGPGELRAAAITGSGVAPQSGQAAPEAAAAAAIRTPFLMLHGSEDSTVRPDQSESLQQVLVRNDVPNERILLEGQGHAIDQTMRDEVFGAIRDWFGTHGVLRSP
jgi:acetyl esterase/lipase